MITVFAGTAFAQPVAPLINSFTNPTPYYNENLGYAVAIIGNGLLAVSAPGDGSPPSQSRNGSVYLLHTNGGTMTVITNPAPLAGQGADARYFGRTITAVGGDKLLVTARRDDFVAGGAGVFLFSTNGSLVRSFLEPGPSNSTLFGFCAAGIGPDKIAIGNLQSVYLFHTNGTLLNTFTNPGVPGFGYAVSAVGADRFVVRTQGDEGTPSPQAAYLYHVNGTHLLTITNAGKRSSHSAHLIEGLAASIASVGTDKILIGAPGASQSAEGISRNGQAFLYDTNGIRLATFINPAPDRTPYFGKKVAAVGTGKLAVSAGVATNAVYIFSIDGTLLSTTAHDGSGSFGFSLAATGNSVLVGATGVPSPNYPSVGAAFLFGSGPDEPFLTIRRSPFQSDFLFISWPAPATGFVLERSPRLGFTGETITWTQMTHLSVPGWASNWTDVSLLPPRTNFYRLRKQ